jgi:hypothetical protein
MLKISHLREGIPREIDKIYKNMIRNFSYQYLKLEIVEVKAKFSVLRQPYFSKYAAESWQAF